jgi:hypothetical protein
VEQAGIDYVKVSDGTADPACAAANGAVVEYALEHLLESPNCTRTFSAAVTAPPS